MNNLLKTALTLLITSSLSCASQQAKTPKESNSLKLINSNSLDGWQGNKKNWSVKDGVITGESTNKERLKHNTFLIWEKELPDNYQFTFKYRFLSPKGNSGIQYNSKVLDSKKFIVSGMQADFETGNTYSGILYEEKGRGILAQRGTTVTVDEKGKKIKTGKLVVPKGVDKSTENDGWQSYKVVFLDNKAIHIINGFATVVVDMKSYSPRAVGKSFALQLHKGPPMKIQFKDIELAELKLEKKSQQKFFKELYSETKNLKSL